MKQNVINHICLTSIIFTHLIELPWWAPLGVSLVAAIILATTNFSDGMNRAERIYRPERFQS